MGTGNGTSRRRVKSLASGRPPTVQVPKALKRKTTKRLINRHHQLEKRRLQAAARGDAAAEAALAAEIAALGGLERYQQASLQGQSRDRGGDSSRVLMQWLTAAAAAETTTASTTGSPPRASSPAGPPAAPPAAPVLRMLEVGALSTDNACSASGWFRMERIDLHSQGPGILQQDFLARPLPAGGRAGDGARFDIISLSLVLNYVPQHRDRGAMLLRCLDFLHEPGRVSGGGAEEAEAEAEAEAGAAPSVAAAARASHVHSAAFPSVFLVLPEPCVTNSRYLTEERLAAIMGALGFDLLASKTSQRLVYYLWKRVRPVARPVPSFGKQELRSGPTRNNFSIVLQDA